MHNPLPGMATDAQIGEDTDPKGQWPSWDHSTDLSALSWFTGLLYNEAVAK